MASSPGPKRRRTSPEESSNWIDASNTTSNIPNPRSSPTKQSRASYLSPTKASLSRHNPSLLPRPVGSGPRQPASKGKPTLQPTTPALLPPGGLDKQLDEGAGLGTAAEILKKPQQAGFTVQESAKAPRVETPVYSARRDGGPVASGGMSAAPRRRSRTPGVPSSPSKTSQFIASQPSGAPQVDVGSEAVGARLQSQRSPRIEEPLPGATTLEPIPSAIREEDEDEPEPELPPTPVELGLEDPFVSRPPAGILSSPSKRARRNRRLSEKLKSSPLKPREDPASVTARVSKTAQDVNVSRQPEPQNPNVQSPSTHTLRNGKRRKTAEKQKALAIDVALASKIRLKELLLAQLKELQDEVSRCEAEVYPEGQAVSQATLDKPSEKQSPNQFLHVLIHPKDYTALPPPPPKPKLPLSFTLSAFLPFSKHLPSRPRKPAPPPSGPIPSNRPIDLEDPLPYLKVFTPLDFSSTTTLLPAPTPTSPLHQQHDITLTSPQHILTAKVKLTVNTSSHTVTSLTLTSLTSWAQSELGSYLQALEINSTSSKDISLLTHAVSTYWTLASTRATCWATLSHEYAHLLPSIEQPPSSKDPPTTTPAATHSAPGEEEDDENEEVSGVSFAPLHTTPNPTNPSRRLLLTHLPRSNLAFLTKDKTVELLISWRISFDWTGEAQSQVAATVRVPSIWTKTDDRSSLAKIPDVFDKLVADRGVLGASRALLGLLFR